MGNLNFELAEQKEDKSVWALGMKSNDKTQSGDIPDLSKKYYNITGKRDGEVLPFFLISQDYDENTRDFKLFIGALIENDRLEQFTIPKGTYVKVTVKPKMGFMWGLAIGEAKREFYTQWLPKSEFEALNMEYEYHTEVSKSKRPQIDIFFGVKRK
ncbi:MAG: GyrI-like domain-containing protein [Clostridiales bacterium]|jgi:predicted transcriptional regulator YdeE|nr:GyrI-like domain-containing protein [Clostridiales bacterium]